MTRLESPAQDSRLTQVCNLDMIYAFAAPASKGQWLTRAAALRQQILVSTGLWPLPEKTPLRARVFGRVVRDGYSVEKVYFESLPGFFVGGNLYRPYPARGRHPGIVNPHGHWTGRLENGPLCSIPGRCINLALQGHVAFSHDMVGYADTNQIPHRAPQEPREELWGISIVGLQLWNSIRAVDFLCSLKDVDPTRIGCTGASGGGTQTFLLSAVDDRIKAAVPVNMVSAHMQGGCPCENAPNLRIDTYNVEIAAMMAPRPLLLVSASGDWTRNNPSVEHPDIRRVYALFGAQERVKCVRFHAGHNYNRDSREAMYAWMGRWLLGIEDEERLREQPFVVEAAAALRAFDGRARPKRALDAAGLTERLVARSRRRIAALMPRDRASLNAYRREMGVALRNSLMAREPDAEEILCWRGGGADHEDFSRERLLLGRCGRGDRIPAVMVTPHTAKARGPAAVIVHERSSSALMESWQGTPKGVLRKLLAAGQRTLVIDAFLTGEAAGERKREVKFFTTYNRTDVAEQVQDILTAVAYLRSRPEVTGVNLIGLGAAGLWCLLAAGLSKGVARAAVDAARFDSGSDAQFTERLFVPHLRAAGDFVTAAALIAPSRLLIHNTGGRFATAGIGRVYRVAGASDRLTLRPERVSAAQLASWIGER